jgi:hypothetical protein
MLITKQTVADKLAAYLRGRVAIGDMVDWAENALLDGEFTEADAPVLSPIVARLGVADGRAFGLVWEDRDLPLRQLGYTARVEIVPPSPYSSQIRLAKTAGITTSQAPEREKMPCNR